MNHTLGPWKTWSSPSSEDSMEYEVWTVSSESGSDIADVFDSGDGHVAANARLIAAAPELLDALRHAAGLLETAYFRGEPPMLATIKDTIAKAEGK